MVGEHFGEVTLPLVLRLQKKIYNVLIGKIQFSPMENIIPVENGILKNEDFTTKYFLIGKAENKIDSLGFYYNL